eukprot:1180937-Prorocentrum_minimum.AAC.4
MLGMFKTVAGLFANVEAFAGQPGGAQGTPTMLALMAAWAARSNSSSSACFGGGCTISFTYVQYVLL